MISVAVMQPYFFPSLGYFQLISMSDRFVFYDDVNFKTQGWIHRNRILIQGSPSYISIPCRKPSQSKLINEIEHNLDTNTKNKLLRKIKITYSNAPFFHEVYNLFEDVINVETKIISDLAMKSVKSTMDYLNIETATEVSSKKFDNQGMGKQERLIDICRKLGGYHYINLPGGRELYNKIDFEKEGVQLSFLDPIFSEYDQFGGEFIPGLSILDVMMFNSVDEIHEMLQRYQLN